MVIPGGLQLADMSKDFHDFYFGLPTQKRSELAAAAETTIGYLERVAGGFRLPSIPMCAKIIRASKGKTSIPAIIKTYEKRNGPV